MPSEMRIGTAAWALSRHVADQFPGPGSHLERYARTLNAVEINSTFYRLPRATTLHRWRDSTPEDFRFSVKVPGSMTHEAGLRGCSRELGHFLELVRGLEPKLGPLLVQLPPSLEFEMRPAGQFLRCLRKDYSGDVVWEPRHATWFGARATALLEQHRVARVAADPAPCAGAELPAAFAGVEYHRLHGSPRKYYSEYSPAYLEALALALRTPRAGEPRVIWCMFDNTALGAALPNAIELSRRLAIDAVRARRR